MSDKLSDRQRAFVEEYLIDYNGTRAAKAAGYSELSARTIASQLLAQRNINSAVAAALAAQIDRTQLTADTVLAGLWREYRKAKGANDALRALELIGKHYAMFTDRVAVDAELPAIEFRLTKDE